MHAEAIDEFTKADARYSDLFLPAVVSIESITSAATSEITDGVAMARNETTMSGVSMLGGLVQIGSIHTTSRASSNGTAAAAGAMTTISDVTFAGVAATIDEDGLHVEDQEPAPTPVDGVLPGIVGEVLRPETEVTNPISAAVREAAAPLDGGLQEFADQSGFNIRRTPDSIVENGAASEAVAGGLLLQFDYENERYPIWSDVLAALPYDSVPGNYSFLPDDVPQPLFTPQALARLFQEQHIFTVTLGSALAGAIASPAFVSDVARPTPTDQVADRTGGVAPALPSAGPPRLSPEASSAPTPDLAGPTLAATKIPLAPGKGIPVSIVLLSIGLFLVGGRVGTALANHSLGDRY